MPLYEIEVHEPVDNWKQALDEIRAEIDNAVAHENRKFESGAGKTILDALKRINPVVMFYTSHYEFPRDRVMMVDFRLVSPMNLKHSFYDAQFKAFADEHVTVTRIKRDGTRVAINK